MRLGDLDKLRKEIHLEYSDDLGILDVIDRQPTANKWIPCSERLPRKHRDVFQVTIIRIQDGYKWVQSMLWNCDEWKWWEEEEGIDVEDYTVIAWKLLPEPYKGE